jgi:hypothetical protein
MGQLILDEVIGLLRDGGIRADAAFPPESIQRITSPVAAVSLEKVDLGKRSTEVRVEILAPKESGGYACQKKALEVCVILEAAGATCCQENCEFLNKANVFRVPVKAVFRGASRPNNHEAMPKYTVTAGDMTLQYVCGFSAQQKVTATSNWQNAPWEVTVEEFFPWGVLPTLEPEEPFQLKLRCMGKTEHYENCRWSGNKRIAEELGIRQIRTASATGRSITSG